MKWFEHVERMSEVRMRDKFLKQMGVDKSIAEDLVGLFSVKRIINITETHEVCIERSKLRSVVCSYTGSPN